MVYRSSLRPNKLVDSFLVFLPNDKLTLLTA